jgi:hypothetical protein
LAALRAEPKTLDALIRVGHLLGAGVIVVSNGAPITVPVKKVLARSTCWRSDA